MAISRSRFECWRNSQFVNRTDEAADIVRENDAETFRFNNRKMEDGDRFSIAMGGVEGKRLTYKNLIGEGVHSPLV